MRFFVGLVILVCGAWGKCLYSDSSSDPFLYDREESLRILGIMSDKVNLNGEWVKKGEYVKGIKVIEIAKDCVILEDRQSFSLCLQQKKILRGQ